MAKNHKSRKKAYTDGYRIIKGRILTDKRNRLQKARTEEQDNVPLFIILTFIKLLENQYFPDIMN